MGKFIPYTVWLRYTSKKINYIKKLYFANYMTEYKRSITLIPIKKNTRAILKSFCAIEGTTYDLFIRKLLNNYSYRP